MSFPFTQLIIFFFYRTTSTDIYTLSLHDALPICFGIFLWEVIGLRKSEAQLFLYPSRWLSGLKGGNSCFEWDEKSGESRSEERRVGEVCSLGWVRHRGTYELRYAVNRCMEYM